MVRPAGRALRLVRSHDTVAPARNASLCTFQDILAAGYTSYSMMHCPTESLRSPGQFEGRHRVPGLMRFADHEDGEIYALSANVLQGEWRLVRAADLLRCGCEVVGLDFQAIKNTVQRQKIGEARQAERPCADPDSPVTYRLDRIASGVRHVLSSAVPTEEGLQLRYNGAVVDLVVSNEFESAMLARSALFVTDGTDVPRRHLVPEYGQALADARELLLDVNNVSPTLPSRWVDHTHPTAAILQGMVRNPSGEAIRSAVPQSMLMDRATALAETLNGFGVPLLGGILLHATASHVLSMGVDDTTVDWHRVDALLFTAALTGLRDRSAEGALLMSECEDCVKFLVPRGALPLAAGFFGKIRQLVRKK